MTRRPGLDSPRAIPILMYHQVSPRPSPGYRKYTLTPQRFARQVAWLAFRGYRAVTLDALLGSPDSLPPKPIVLTFDDGYEDAVSWTIPVLQRHGFTATYFIVAGLVGQTTRWLTALRGFELPLVGWHGLREIAAAGFTIGSHTVTHPHLTDLSTDACREELEASRKVLEDGAGVEVAHFAYPFGAHDARTRDLVLEAGYRSASTVDEGIETTGGDPFLLRRVPVNGTESFVDFAWRVRTGERPGPWLRAQLPRRSAIPAS